MHCPAWIIASIVIAIGLSSSGAAFAQPSPRVAADRNAAADALFDQGKRLMAAGRFAEACGKFIESERIDHGTGTLLNLADCYEQNGQTASAWAQFQAAAAAANAEGQTERERIARERERRLEPNLARLTIVVPWAETQPGIVVKRDDLPVDKAIWGVPVPVDPGDHTLEVSVPGKATYARTIKVPKSGGARITETIPPLADPPVAPPGPPARLPAPPPPPGPRFGTQQIAGIAVGAVGLAGIAVGSALGLHAISRNAASVTHCRGDHCDAAGVGIRRDALAAGTGSTVAFVAAGAALAAGATIFFMAPKKGRPVASATVGLGAAGAEIFMGTTW